MQKARQANLVFVVTGDFELIIGGPVGHSVCAARFEKGQELVVRRRYRTGQYPRMYSIDGYESLGLVSRGVLARFLDGFDPSREAPV